MALDPKNTKSFINVLGSTGDLRMAVDEGTENAVRREYETSDGKKGVKHELVFKSISGKIANVEFFEGDYGKNLIITFDFEDGNEPTALSLGTQTPFGEDVMKKLPNINYNEHVVFTPYSFEDDNGKLRRGVTIKQGDEKIQGAFFDPEKKENLLGFPDPEGDTTKFDTDDWKIYFTKARKFLVQYTEENILPQFAGATSSVGEKTGDDF